jgi:nucleoside-diphosphate-sugar epimerase
MKQKSRCAISGSSGLIGSKLVEVLKADGIPRELLYDPFKLNEFIKGYDTVIHCASYGNHHWQTDLQQIFISNVFATENLLEASRINGVKNFMFMGSSSEYGDKYCPMVEEMSLETYSMYGCCKVAGEYLTRHYSAYMNTVTVRPFSVYGPKEDEGMFIPTLIRCIKSGEMFLLRDGNHDWVYVDDFARATQIILKNIHLLSGLTLNVGTGINITNEEIITTLLLATGTKLLMKKIEGNNPLWVADSGKIRSLGWKPKVSIYEGLKRCYEGKDN